LGGGHAGQQIPAKASFKPLSVERESAIDCCILGKSDRETAESVGVNRMTIWEWSHEHPLFMATLERRRAEVWRQPQERLRSLLSKAVENLRAAGEEGDLKASIEALNAVGMYGDGTMNTLFEQDPAKLICQQAEAQVDSESVSKNALAAMVEHLDTAAYRTQLAEVETEIRNPHLAE
jgi:hypothetical protein